MASLILGKVADGQGADDHQAAAVLAVRATGDSWLTVGTTVGGSDAEQHLVQVIATAKQPPWPLGRNTEVTERGMSKLMLTDIRHSVQIAEQLFFKGSGVAVREGSMAPDVEFEERSLAAGLDDTFTFSARITEF